MATYIFLFIILVSTIYLLYRDDAAITDYLQKDLPPQLKATLYDIKAFVAASVAAALLSIVVLGVLVLMAVSARSEAENMATETFAKIVYLVIGACSFAKLLSVLWLRRISLRNVLYLQSSPKFRDFLHTVWMEVAVCVVFILTSFLHIFVL